MNTETKEEGDASHIDAGTRVGPLNKKKLKEKRALGEYVTAQATAKRAVKSAHEKGPQSTKTDATGGGIFSLHKGAGQRFKGDEARS